jgi:hypothetical protein
MLAARALDYQTAKKSTQWPTANYLFSTNNILAAVTKRNVFYSQQEMPNSSVSAFFD